MTCTGNVMPKGLLPTCVATLLMACTTNAPVQIIRGIPPIDRSVAAAVSVDVFIAGRFTAHNGMVLPYRMLAPEHIEPGRRYPLVVQFHGSGGIGNDNRSQVEIAAKAWALPEIRLHHPAFVLVPQFPVRSADYDDPVTPRSAQASPALVAALDLVENIAASQPVDRQRIYATGFSMGGSAAWLAPMLRPGLFAAAVPVSGIAPDRSQAGLLKGLPLLVLHGDADTENPILADREMVQAIRALGGRRIHLRVYSGLTHQPPGDLIPGDWWRDWLFMQTRVDGTHQANVRDH
jgi:predicted peptidase